MKKRSAISLRRKVYLETSVISYHTGRASTDLIVRAKQHMTVMWWDQVLPKVEAFISDFVIEEINKGDAAIAAMRLELVSNLKALPRDRVGLGKLVDLYLKKGSLPEKARFDAFHIACATIFEMDYLLTWNCSHIANAFVRRAIERVNADSGYDTPVICTPEELMEVGYESTKNLD